MAFSGSMSKPGQFGKDGVAKGRLHCSPLQVKGKGEQVQYNSKSTSGARASRVGNRPERQSIQSIEALPGLLQGSIMGPNCGGVGDRRANHCGIDPLSDTGPRAPVPSGGREEGIEEALSLGCLE